MKKKFVPQGTFVLIEVPEEAYKSDIILPDGAKEQKRKDWLEAGKPLTVVAVGDQVRFTSPGDSILANSRGYIIVDLDTPTPYYIIRESEITGKFVR
jgi:co-chaperonin GroES (HSP10)